jgi:hypothetical protein
MNPPYNEYILITDLHKNKKYKKEAVIVAQKQAING